MEPVNSPWAGRIFRYGITAVGPNGPLVRAISEPIPTHDGERIACDEFVEIIYSFWNSVGGNDTI